MFIHEYGSRDDPTVILLAPMRLEATLQFGLGNGSVSARKRSVRAATSVISGLSGTVPMPATAGSAAKASDTIDVILSAER